MNVTNNLRIEIYVATEEQKKVAASTLQHYDININEAESIFKLFQNYVANHCGPRGGHIGTISADVLRYMLCDAIEFIMSGSSLFFE